MIGCLFQTSAPGLFGWESRFILWNWSCGFPWYFFWCSYTRCFWCLAVWWWWSKRLLSFHKIGIIFLQIFWDIMLCRVPPLFSNSLFSLLYLRHRFTIFFAYFCIGESTVFSTTWSQIWVKMRENIAGLAAKFHVKNGKTMCTNEFVADL